MPPKQPPAIRPTVPPPDEPTPEQAARALRELTARRHEVLRTRTPRWLWWFGGVWFPAVGLAEDVSRPAARLINLGVIGVLLAIAFSVRYRRVGSVLGFRASVRGQAPAGVAVVTIGAILAIIAVESALRKLTEQIYPHWSHTIAGVV